MQRKREALRGQKSKKNLVYSLVTYTVELSKTAEKQFKKLDKELQKRIAKKIDMLAKTPRLTGMKKLSSEDDVYRIREGDYRIVYAIQDSKLLVLVVKIGHRREVYR